jgi:GTP-binding protein
LNIKSATYLISSPEYKKCPAPDKAEYAFIGRSNVGKSSLINMICNQQGLAKISRSPGKTQLINHFLVKGGDLKTSFEWYLVDLPGYGFAKVSQAQRKNWEKMIKGYLLHRENLGCVFILIDSRHEPQQIDLDFITQLGEWRIPFAIAFTKADKNTQKDTARHVRLFLDRLAEQWETLPPHFVTSAVKKSGRTQLLAYIEEMNKGFTR